MKKVISILMLSAFMGFAFNANAQTIEEIAVLEAKKAEKEAAAAALQGELNNIKKEIADITTAINKKIRWTFGSGGIIGADLNGFKNWAPKPDYNSSAQSIAFSYNGFANLKEDKYFWRNNGGINLGWLRYDDNTEIDEQGEDKKFKQVADVFNMQSLFGYSIIKNLAVSTLGEYRSTILSNANNPGFLDLGVGITYNPKPNLAIVLHPLNYNFIFAKDKTDFNSSLGAKFVIDYNTTLIKGVKWRSNVSGFYSYSGADFSNYTWVNAIKISAYKAIGIGIEYGLRLNPQETEAKGIASKNQSYYAIGLSYSL